MKEESSLWWENITGPLMLIEQIAGRLADGQCVILQNSRNLPWKGQMRDLIMHRLEGVSLRPLDLEPAGVLSEVAPWLLRRIRSPYLTQCPPQYTSQLSYLKETGSFSSTVIWITVEEGQDASQAVRFLSDYRSRRLGQDGTLLLELPDAVALPRLSSRVEVIDCNSMIRRGDIRLFASILADELREIPEGLRSYAACVSANLVDGHVEWIPVLLHGMDFAQEEPDAVFYRLWETGALDGGMCPDVAALKRAVWRSQLQVAFAGIELSRLQITDRHARAIECALGTRYYDPKTDTEGMVSQRDDSLKTAADVELSTLVYMHMLRRADDHNERLLELPEDGIWDSIHFLKDCRNLLAHHRMCSPADMALLFEELEK